MEGKLGLSIGLDTGFGVATLVAGVAVDSGVCVIAVACVGATPSLSSVLAASQKGTTGGGCPDSVLAAKFVPLHSDQGGGMSVSRVSVSAADAASRASCPPA